MVTFIYRAETRLGFEKLAFLEQRFLGQRTLPDQHFFDRDAVLLLDSKDGPKLPLSQIPQGYGNSSKSLPRTVLDVENISDLMFFHEPECESTLTGFEIRGFGF